MKDKVLDWIMLPDPSYRNRMFFVNADWMVAWSGATWQAFQRHNDEMTEALHSAVSAQDCMDWVAQQIQEAEDA